MTFFKHFDTENLLIHYNMLNLSILAIYSGKLNLSVN